MISNANSYCIGCSPEKNYFCFDCPCNYCVGWQSYYCSINMCPFVDNDDEIEDEEITDDYKY